MAVANVSFVFSVELIEFPVGLIAGVILSAVVVTMVAAKLVCVAAARYRLHRALAAGDVYSDTDEQRDMLTAVIDDPPRCVDVGIDDIPDPPCGERHHQYHHLLTYLLTINWTFSLFNAVGITVPIRYPVMGLHVCIGLHILVIYR